jgi:hypothetical protein
MTYTVKKGTTDLTRLFTTGDRRYSTALLAPRSYEALVLTVRAQNDRNVSATEVLFGATNSCATTDCDGLGGMRPGSVGNGWLRGRDSDPQPWA